jgi:hypothetical protein
VLAAALTHVGRCRVVPLEGLPARRSEQGSPTVSPDIVAEFMEDIERIARL